ncbi:energy transducer TonB [Dyadobacter sp. CY323]|uniref:energy transducer TonB n=1 Tax=Dyadobacter sp. CY323 TaxID=2907302 RepID=UPI001F207CE3|nr:energy transducer TonB [Dyadobacter sp. CY323]MCE6991900.1 TonB family protein [Dyadobacter sp. CY323]
MNLFFLRGVFCLIFISFNALSQTDSLHIFYDAEWNVISDGSKAEYKRSAYENDNGYWQVTDYYKTGQVQMTGLYLEKEMKTMQGRFEWFYPSGQLKRQTSFASNRVRDEEFEYYENGQLDTYRKYDNAGRTLEERLYKEDSSPSIFHNAEFPSGKAAMYDYLSRNIKYPKSLRKRGIEGKVFVSFVVHTDGSLRHVTIFGSPHELLSQEALRVVKSMPKWKPGSRDEKLVAVKYNLPIAFALD